MAEESGATTIASMPQIENGLKKAVAFKSLAMVQIRVKHVNYLWP
jgi:hypothetical protein